MSAVLGCILLLILQQRQQQQIVFYEIPCYLFRGLVVPTVVDMLAVVGAIHPLMNLRVLRRAVAGQRPTVVGQRPLEKLEWMGVESVMLILPR